MKNIVLIGFMGTGKTSTGKLLANRLGRPFIDSDRKIEMETGMAIGELFRIHGEAYFRQREKEVIAKVSRYKNTVIATGGGIVLLPENITRLKMNGVLIALTATVEVILERTGRRNLRPLLDCPEREKIVEKLLHERAELYQRAHFSIDTSNYSPQQVSDSVIDFLRQGGYLRGRS
jgi:shikimate kinase